MLSDFLMAFVDVELHGTQWRPVQHGSGSGLSDQCGIALLAVPIQGWPLL